MTHPAQYKGLVCPLDGYELLLFSLAGQDGKTYPLCPLCYSYPPFEVCVGATGCGAVGQGQSELLPSCSSTDWRQVRGGPLSPSLLPSAL